MGDKRLGHRLFMLGFIAAPLVVLAVLVSAMTTAMQRGPGMRAERLGAGAGQTGGANALGEAIFGGSGDVGIPAEQTARGALLVVRDQSGVAGEDRPIYLVTNHGGWKVSDSLRLSPARDGLWQIRAPVPQADEMSALAFRFVLGSEALPEIDDEGREVGERRLPRVRETEAVGRSPLSYEFVIRGFGQR